MRIVTSDLPSVVTRYLSALEREAKQLVGVVPEDILEEARSRLLEIYSELEGEGESLVYQSFVEEIGTPAERAQGYEPLDARQNARQGNAPGWRICCTRCGRSSPADRLGIVRIGAKSYHKYVRGNCSDCQASTWMRLIQDLEDDNLTRRLGSTRSGAELRQKMHRPRFVLLLILAVVVAINSATFFGVLWLLKVWN